MNIHHITPGRSNLNYGNAINDIVKCLPDEDWICLRDIDTMPSYHEVFFKQVEDISKTDFALVGCMTNRLGLKNQLINEIFSENTDWKHHRAIGKREYAKHGSKVRIMDFKKERIADCVGGVMLLFPKKIWKEVGGFREGQMLTDGGFIDWHFSKAIIEKGYKVGIAEGIYMIHMYRPDAANPKSAIQHLIRKN